MRWRSPVSDLTVQRFVRVPRARESGDDLVPRVEARAAEGRLLVSATLKLTRSALGMELRGGTFDVMIDDKEVGSIERHDTIEAPLQAGRHTLQVRKGRYSSPKLAFDVADGEIATFRCHGAHIWPIWLAAFAIPRLALSLRRE